VHRGESQCFVGIILAFYACANLLHTKFVGMFTVSCHVKFYVISFSKSRLYVTIENLFTWLLDMIFHQHHHLSRIRPCGLFGSELIF
jgi:hypothetical protein